MLASPTAAPSPLGARIAASTPRTRSCPCARTRTAATRKSPRCCETSPRRCPAAFHAITSARSKRYAYYLGFSDDAARYAWPAPPGLDVGRVRRGGALLVGERDFRAFCAPGGRDRGTTVRSITAIDVDEVEAVDLPFAGRVRGLVRIAFDGDGFLKHQCRRIVGALARLGAGDLSEAQVEAALADPRGAHPEVSSRRFEAPAHGLWLERVDCGDDSY